MLKSSYILKFLSVGTIFLCINAFRADVKSVRHKPTVLDEPNVERAKPRRMLLKELYTSQLGVRELSGKNDGKEVEQHLRYVGLKKGNPWCAAFVCWGLGGAGIDNPRSGWSPDLFPASKVIWRRTGKLQSKADKIPREGDVFGIWFPDKQRIAHVGFVDAWDGKWMISVEGNTNEAGSAEGDGVYRKRRLTAGIYKVADYIGEEGI